MGDKAGGLSKKGAELARLCVALAQESKSRRREEELIVSVSSISPILIPVFVLFKQREGLKKHIFTCILRITISSATFGCFDLQTI